MPLTLKYIHLNYKNCRKVSYQRINSFLTVVYMGLIHVTTIFARSKNGISLTEIVILP